MKKVQKKTKRVSNKASKISQVSKRIKKVSGNISDSTDREAQGRQSLINPIIQALGWDIENPKQCRVEYPSGVNRVDYILLEGEENPVVIIEAKKVGKIKTDGKDQLFGYGRDKKSAPLLVLTDGDTWNFYLNKEFDGDTRAMESDEYFYQAVLSNLSGNKGKRDECAEYFVEYLEKVRVCKKKGRRKAVDAAKSRFDANSCIEKVWQYMLNGSKKRGSNWHNQLCALLSKAVKKECGTEPESEDLGKFLGKQAKLVETQASIVSTTSESKPSRKISSGLPASPVNSSGKVRIKIIGYTFKGGSPNLYGRGRQTLEAILRYLGRDSGFMQRFNEKLIEKRMGKRWVVTQNPEKDWAGWEKYFVDLENGWWFYKCQNSNKYMISYIEIACEVAGIKYGSEDGLKLIFKNKDKL